MTLTDRFLKYVSYHTTSDENTGMTPSTPGLPQLYPGPL